MSAVVAAILVITAGSFAAETPTASNRTDGGVELTLTRLGNGGDVTLMAQFFPKIDAVTGQLSDLDARLSYVADGHVFTATLVDRRGYSTVQEVATGTFVDGGGAEAAACLAASQVPPIASLVDAFLHPAVVTDAATMSSGLSCASGSQAVEFVIERDAYAFCATSDSIGNTTKTAPSAVNTLALLRANSHATPPRPSILPANRCDVLYDDAALASLKAPPIQAPVVSQNQRVLKEEAASCSCKGGLKACLFIHGMGLSADGPALDEYTKCWGDIKTKAQCCSSMKFMQMDTVNNAWHSESLAKKVCDTAATMATAGSDPMALEGIALVGHSMGNLVVANAALRGICAIGASSKWISLAGPILGSQSANLALTKCSSSDSATVGTLSFFGLCPVGATVASLPYVNSNASSATLNTLYELAGAVYRKRVTSNLCGVSATGLTSTRSVRYGLLGSISGHLTSENDGAVHLLSCQAGLDPAKYSTSWSGGNFYKADINHGDASFVSGDGLWGDARKPIQWFNCQF